MALIVHPEERHFARSRNNVVNDEIPFTGFPLWGSCLSTQELAGGCLVPGNQISLFFDALPATLQQIDLP
jgi:hypothetical protein